MNATPASRPARARLALTPVAVALIVVACGSGVAPGWTFTPAQLPAAPGSAAPSAVPSAEPSAGASAGAGASAPAASASLGASASPAPSASPGPATPAYTLVEKKPCPDTTTFECVTLAVPKDHFAAASGPTWDITFAIHKATKERKGTYVEITGGPGYSDIPTRDGYVDDYYAPSISEDYDMVWLDQRGIGLSGPIQCTRAAAAYYVTIARPQVPNERDNAAAAAQTFAKDCVAESGVAEADLPFYATKQAVEDLEAVRAYLGVDKMDLYGLSYGTQFVQTYAAAHPDHIATLYVDGPVDLTIDGPTYYVEATRSAEDTLVAVLDACTAEPTCKRDVQGGDALAAYDDLAATLRTSRVSFPFTKSDGTTVERTFNDADLETAAFNALYYDYDRLLLQRAVGAASRSDLVPMARLLYGALGLDPDTLQPQADPGYSDALYYAVECQDYAFFPDAGDPEARLDAWVASAEANGINDSRLESAYYGDLPCLYWPTATTDSKRPAPLKDTPYPVFVLTSTTDPATPIANGMRIYSRLRDAWFIQALGGSHVIYGWGQACPDDLMTAWLADRTPPSARVTTCTDWEMVGAYVANPAPTARLYRDALSLTTSVDGQVFNTYDFIYFEATEPVTAGCDFGGTITYTPTDTGTEVRLRACEFTPGLPLTARGETDDEAGTFELKLSSGKDRLTYERDADGNTTVTGTYGGKKVDEKAAA